MEINEAKYELRRLPPDVGSFIFMRMLGLSMRASAEAPEPKKQERQEPPEDRATQKLTGEMRVRALSFAVFSGGIAFDDFKFIQRECMKVVSRANDTGFYIPVMQDNGDWTPAGEELATDVGQVMRLTTEVLILCFADFFDAGNPGS